MVVKMVGGGNLQKTRKYFSLAVWRAGGIYGRSLLDLAIASNLIPFLISVSNTRLRKVLRIYLESKFRGQIISNLNRIKSMITNLLDANRLRASEALALKFEECDLGSLLQQIAAEMSLALGDRLKINLEIYKTPD